MVGRMNGRIIFLNGTSSAGKSTIAKALRPKLDAEFCYYSSDQLADGGFRPMKPAARIAGRQKFFDGFHRSIPAMASAGIDLLVEHIVEEQKWADDLAKLLKGFDVFWVGIHASIEELERREKLRHDRAIGEARYHMGTHAFCRYQVEVESSRPLDEITAEIAEAWRSRTLRESQTQRPAR